MRLGIVDLGTLSLRFDLYEVVPGRRPELVEKHRAMPRLGDGLYASGKLSDEACSRVLTEMEQVAALAQSAAADRIVAVGTSALRDDGAELCRQIQERTGIVLRVLSGEEEAQLTALGILSNEKNLPEDVLFVDIGGGSTEIGLAKKGVLLATASVPLGALRLQQHSLTRNAAGHYEPEAVEAARKEIHSRLALLSIPRREAKKIAGSSGTLRTLERLGVGRSHHIRLEPLQAFCAALAVESREESMKRKGMEASRVDVILPGAMILEAIMQMFEIDAAYVSHFSLRHGVLAEEFKMLGRP